MKTYKDYQLEPVYVHDPFSEKPVNVAPFLYTMHEYFSDFEEAAEELAQAIEHIASHLTEEMMMHPYRMQTHFWNLILIRRMLVAMKTGEMPYCE